MKKSIFLFFAAILCATSAWAYDLPAGNYVYFVKPNDWSKVALLLGHDTYSIGYDMKNIANTSLYYWKTDAWGGYKSYAFIDANGWGGQNWGDCAPDKRKVHAAHYSSTFIIELKKYHLFSSTTALANNTSTYTTPVNRTQTIKVQIQDGSNWVDATTAPADLTASTYALTSVTASGAKSAKITAGSSTVSTTVSGAYSATVTLACANVADGYVFEGWYDSNGNKITSYTISAATTVYARFIETAEETNEVSVTYMCGTTSVATAVTEFVGVETEKSFTAPTNITGYNFTGWTIGAGITLKAGTASDATITVVTKSASSDYSLVANYEEVLETVYFINTNKWARVNIHKWNGKAADSSWPGEQLTPSGEKIGEYDVYSYTAKQGDYANIIFNSKTSGTDGGNAQTADLTWTAGKYYIHNYGGKSDWYTKEEAEALLVVPVVEETVYFVNNKKWTKVQAYAWNATGNNGWPGVALTPTGEKVADFDVYSYTAPQGYANVIFNNKTGDSGEQSADFVWTNGKYYYMDAANNYAGGTKEEVAVLVTPDPLATGVYLAGDMTNKDNWDVNKKEFKKAIAEATTASVTVTLEAQTYKFKLVIDGAWKGNTGTMQRGGDAVHEGGWSFDKDGYDDNCQIVADIAGDYTFTWNLTDKKLTVAYPPLPKYTVTATAENGSVTGAGEYEQGSEATLVATPDAGYAFKNWTKGGEEVSTEATYTFTVTTNVELVANFVPEETHEVTVSYLCNATPIPGQTTQTLAVGVTTPSTITAPAITHYTFDGWTLGTGVQAVDANANPIQITTKAEGEYTLTANYTKIELTYTVKVPAGTEQCYIVGDMNGWNEKEAIEMEDQGSNVFSVDIVGATKEQEYKYLCAQDWAYVEKTAGGEDVENRKWSDNDVVAAWGAPVEVKCYLMGNGDWDNGVEMTLNPDNDNEYMLLDHYISAPFKFKLGDEWSDQVENHDFPGINWKDGNIELPEGIYDFYFKKDSKKAYIAAVYLRDVTNTWGTICLPHASTSFSGAKFYEVSSLNPTKGLWLDEIEAGAQLVAGKPYVFEATASTIKVTYTDKAVAAPQAGKNGLTGTFTDIAAAEDGVLVGNYIIGGNKVHVATAQNDLPANRAYINAALVPNKVQAEIPGRRRVCMGENAATGLDQIVAPAGQAVKIIENGQLIIIRDGVKYNVQGQKL